MRHAPLAQPPEVKSGLDLSSGQFHFLVIFLSHLSKETTGNDVFWAKFRLILPTPRNVLLTYFDVFGASSPLGRHLLPKIRDCNFQAATAVFEPPPVEREETCSEALESVKITYG